MKSIKPGRGPSMMGGIMAIAIAVCGLLWTIGAAGMTSSFSGMGLDGGYGIGGGMDVVFPLFGVVFVFVAVALAVYHFKNATGKQRYSVFDIVDEKEESDPLNTRFGEQMQEAAEGKKKEEAAAFCPYCGTPVETDYRFCKSCGKRLPETDE